MNFYTAYSLKTLDRSNKYCLRVFVSLIWLLNGSIYRMFYHWSSSFSYSSFTFLSRGCIRLDSPCLHPFPYARRHFITNSITPRTARRFSAIGRFTRLHSLSAHVIMFYYLFTMERNYYTCPCCILICSIDIAAFVRSRLRLPGYRIERVCVWLCVTAEAGCLKWCHDSQEI